MPGHSPTSAIAATLVLGALMSVPIFPDATATHGTQSFSCPWILPPGLGESRWISIGGNNVGGCKWWTPEGGCFTPCIPQADAIQATIRDADGQPVVGRICNLVPKGFGGVACLHQGGGIDQVFCGTSPLLSSPDLDVAYEVVAGDAEVLDLPGCKVGLRGWITLTVHPGSPGPVPHDAFANAKVIGSLPYADSAATWAATSEAGEPEPCGLEQEAHGWDDSVWYRFVPAASGTLIAHTAGSDFSTYLQAYQGTALANLSPLGCKGAANPEKDWYHLAVSAAAGVPLYFQVGGIARIAGNLQFHLEGHGPPPSPQGDWCNYVAPAGSVATFRPPALLNDPQFGGCVWNTPLGKCFVDDLCIQEGAQLQVTVTNTVGAVGTPSARICADVDGDQAFCESGEAGAVFCGSTTMPAPQVDRAYAVFVLTTPLIGCGATLGLAGQITLTVS